MSDLTYIHKRLDSLHEIDTKLVSSLDNLSSIMATLRKGKVSGSNDELQREFVANVHDFYSNLSNASVSLRKEVKNLDDKISNNSEAGDGDTGMNVLPININKKAVWTGNHKLGEEIAILSKLIPSESEKQEETVDE